MTRGQEGRPILVVEDEEIVSEVVTRYLRREGFRVKVAADGASALNLAVADPPQLVVLDLMLPDMNGLEVCRQLRASGRVPILILTAKDTEADEVLSLGLGADDYISKPLRPSALVARVKALLRRAAAVDSASGVGELSYDGLSIDPRSRRVTHDDKLLTLTAKEFDLLLFLARHPGEVFSRQQLLDSVWDYTFVGESSTVTVHVRRLREKIESDPLHPRYIKTVWGVGYKLDGDQ